MTQLRHSPVRPRPRATTFQHIEVTQVGGLIGGVAVGGIRIGGNASSLRRSLNWEPPRPHPGRYSPAGHQHHATNSDQLAFAALLGEVTKSPPNSRRMTGRPSCRSTPSKARPTAGNTADVTFVDRAPAISKPRAIKPPPYGGTTVWANTVEAYVGGCIRPLQGPGRQAARRPPRTSTTLRRTAPRSAASTSRRSSTREQFRQLRARDRAPRWTASTPGDRGAVAATRSLRNRSFVG